MNKQYSFPALPESAEYFTYEREDKVHYVPLRDTVDVTVNGEPVTLTAHQVLMAFHALFKKPEPVFEPGDIVEFVTYGPFDRPQYVVLNEKSDAAQILRKHYGSKVIPKNVLVLLQLTPANDAGAWRSADAEYLRLSIKERA